MPGLFVLLWSTGFIGAKYGLPYVGPMTFLAWRYAIVIVLLGTAALIWRAPWPATWADAGHAMIAGLLLHGIYLGGVFTAIVLGMPAGVIALIVGLQPMLTAVLSGPLLGERVTRRHWMGVGLGFIGIALVLAPKLEGTAAVPPAALISGLIALAGITLGTIHQKRSPEGTDLRTGGVLQYVGALIPTAILAWWLEGFAADWTPQLIGTMAWLVLVLSVGAIFLLMTIIRHGAVAQVATYFYLVPPLTAVLAYLLFGETLNALQGAGMTLVAAAVWLSGRTGRGSAA